MLTTKLENGRFDVQDASGTSVLDPLGGPFQTREAAEAAQRMLSAFDNLDAQIKTINNSLERMKPHEYRNLSVSLSD